MGYGNLSLAPAPTAPAVARAHLKDLLQDAPADVLEDVLLLTTEVLTNSLRHAPVDVRDRIHLAVHTSEDAVRVEVTDPGTGAIFTPRIAEPHETGGRGLLLLAELSDRWGIDRSQATTVWFELSFSERLESRAG